MKKIIYTDTDGSVSVVTPSEGFRLAFYITLDDGTVLQNGARRPAPVDSFLRRWPVSGAVAEWAETEEQWLERVAARSVPPDAADSQIVDEADIPADRTFRGAWKAEAGRVEHDMAKCKAIAHERRRAARAAEFAPLDDAIAKKIPGTDEAKVEAQRQAVRDKYTVAQAAIDEARTVEEIKAALA